MHSLDQTEQDRRKDITQSGVAQEAIDCYESLIAAGKSSSEAFTENGYSIEHVLKPAIREERRIVCELNCKISAEVSSDYLVVADVKTKYDIPEYPEEPDFGVEPG